MLRNLSAAEKIYREALRVGAPAKNQSTKTQMEKLKAEHGNYYHTVVFFIKN